MAQQSVFENREEKELKEQGEQREQDEEKLRQSLMKKHGIKNSSELEKELTTVVDSVVSSLFLLTSMDKQSSIRLEKILKGGIESASPTTISSINKRVSQYVEQFKAKKKYVDYYVEYNFTSSLLESFGKPKTIEDLLILVLKLSRENKAKPVIDAMLSHEDFYELAYVLKNSDIIVQHVFVRNILPNLLACAFTASSLDKVLTSLKALVGKTSNHKEFFRILEKFNGFIFYFGAIDGDFVEEFLRCLV